MNELPFKQIWDTLPFPAFVIGKDDTLLGCNSAAESFVRTSSKRIAGQKLSRFVGGSSVTLDAVRQAREGGGSIVLHDVEIGWSDKALLLNHIDASAMPAGNVLMIFHPRGMAEKMDRSLTHRTAARSVSGMAAMLAHEIRNPLAGIKGAAQLLAMNISDDDSEFTQLIQDETERIGKLVDKVEQFGDQRPAQKQEVNIHDVLDRSKRAALAGFARHAKFIETYDPSLPAVAGDPDQLLQVFQNLLKNAAEAIPEVGGTIQLRTAFRPGVRLQLPGRQSESLPLQVIVSDNGKGIPESMIKDIFDPFISSKAAGSGLGLSLVSKIIADHGGVVECESEPGRTQFEIRLPVWQDTEKEKT